MQLRLSKAQSSFLQYDDNVPVTKNELPTAKKLMENAEMQTIQEYGVSTPLPNTKKFFQFYRSFLEL